MGVSSTVSRPLILYIRSVVISESCYFTFFPASSAWNTALEVFVLSLYKSITSCKLFKTRPLLLPKGPLLNWTLYIYCCLNKENFLVFTNETCIHFFIRYWISMNIRKFLFNSNNRFEPISHLQYIKKIVSFNPYRFCKKKKNPPYYSKSPCPISE